MTPFIQRLSGLPLALILLNMILLTGAASLKAAPQARISQASGLGNTSGLAVEPSAALDPDRNQILLVWWGRDDQLPSGATRTIISGRLVDATTGQPLGPVMRLDNDDFGVNALQPAVAFNPMTQEYLVVWAAEIVATHYELRVQRLAASNLQPQLAQPRQITQMGGAGNGDYSALAPAVAFNPDRNEYLVAFAGSDSRVGMTDLQREVFIQRLAGTDATEIGGDDVRISTASTPDGSRGVKLDSRVDVAYSTINRNYLVVWAADDPGAGLAQGETEIFGQLIDGSGQELGIDDVRLSTVGPPGNAFFDAEQPSVSATDSNFGIAFRADAVQGDKEIFGVRAGGTGGQPFGGQQRITFTQGGAASSPRLVRDTANTDLVVAFLSREVLGSAPQFESEVFVQRVNAQLQPLGDAERWSVMGPDGSDDFGPSNGLAMTSLSGGGYYVGWSGDHDADGQIDSEIEVFGRSSVVDALFSDDFE